MSGRQRRRRCKPFSSTSGGNRYTIFTEFNDWLSYRCGGDVEGFFKAYLKRPNEKSQFLLKILRQLCVVKDTKFITKWKATLCNIKNAHDKAPNFQKRSILSLVCGQHTPTELKQLGFKFGKEQFKSAQKIAQSKMSGIPLIETRGRISKITDKNKKIVARFYRTGKIEGQRIVSPAANKTINLFGEIVPIFYAHFPPDYVYHHLKNSYIEKNKTVPFSLSIFKKLIPTYVKKPKKQTDMCEYCVHGKGAYQSYKKILKDIHKNCQKSNCQISINCTAEEILSDRFNLCTQQKLMMNKNNFIELKERVQNYVCHLKRRATQQTAYKTAVSNLKSSECLLVIDFKENISLNLASIEIGSDFYSKPQVSVFGVVAVYKDSNNIKRYFYFDIFSQCLSKSSSFVIKALNLVFDSKSWKDLKLSKIDVWMDNAPHFRSKELFCYFYKNKISWDFFCELHGKNICDSRFSYLSNVLTTQSSKPGSSIFTISDAIAEIKKASHITNSLKINPLEKTQSEQLELIVKELPHEINKLKKFEDLKIYFSFKPHNQSIMCYLNTGDTNGRLQKVSIETKKTKRKSKFGFETSVKKVSGSETFRRLNNRVKKTENVALKFITNDVNQTKATQYFFNVGHNRPINIESEVKKNVKKRRISQKTPMTKITKRGKKRPQNLINKNPTKKRKVGQQKISDLKVNHNLSLVKSVETTFSLLDELLKSFNKLTI